MSKESQNQRITLVVFLMLHTTTAAMVTKAARVDQKNIAHCKKYLEELGMLQEIEMNNCKLIDYEVFFLATHKELFSKYFGL